MVTQPNKPKGKKQFLSMQQISKIKEKLSVTFIQTCQFTPTELSRVWLISEVESLYLPDRLFPPVIPTPDRQQLSCTFFLALGKHLLNFTFVFLYKKSQQLRTKLVVTKYNFICLNPGLDPLCQKTAQRPLFFFFLPLTIELYE